MCRPVNRDDYLLVRGANPRTGVVTPGSRSSSSPIDRGEINRTQGPERQSRWRQRGDQWISLDLGLPTPSSTPPSDKLLEPFPQRLRTPSRLTDTNNGPSSDERERPSTRHLRMQNPVSIIPPRGTTATSHLRQHSDGIGIYPEMLHDDVRPPPPLNTIKGDRMIRRKPVGSPPSKGAGSQESQRYQGTNESTGTVLKSPRINSSAPDPPNMRSFVSNGTDKALPTLPSEPTSPPLNKNQINATDTSFLGSTLPGRLVDSPNSKISNISSHPMIEKELPCLPTDDGQSPLYHDSTPLPLTAREEEKSNNMQDLPKFQTITLQDPRGGDPSYPFVRTARPMHTYPPTARDNIPRGERAMPIPVYDNPPKHLSPLMRMTAPKARGSRSIPPPGMNRFRGDLNPSSNIAIVPTNISMNRSGIPRPFRPSPRPDPWMMNRGRHSLPPRPPPPTISDTFMNAGMNMNTDMMMSIPLPRIRPRGMSRPQMPMRAEGMNGVPRAEPNHNRPKMVGMESPAVWRPPEIETSRIDHVEQEQNPVPPPLKTRVPEIHEPLIPNEVQTSQTKDRTKEETGGSSLMRKCSHCQHEFTDVQPRNTDSVICTSVQLRDDAEASQGTKRLHPACISHPGLPEERTPPANDEADLKAPTSSLKNNDVDDRDHTNCYPVCCKDEDCHEGCLGHCSPGATPSPAKRIWGAAYSPSSASEVEGWEGSNSSQSNEKSKSKGFAFVRSALKRSSKKESPKSSQEFSSKAEKLTPATGTPTELSAHPQTPATSKRNDQTAQLNGAPAASLTNMESTKRKTSSHGFHKRQGSSSSPVTGVGVSSQKSSDDQSDQAASGSRLSDITPAGPATTCSGRSESRNLSDTSDATSEPQVPGPGALGGGVIAEVVLVPFEATKMWIRNHPQVIKIGWEILERGWQMGQVIGATGWRLWTVVFVYSKTGKLAKGETAGGFVIDCARSALYLLVFAAVSVFIIRVLRILLDIARAIGWLFRAIFWVLKHVGGYGIVK
ncbi:uncharacterized protein Z518_08375 [Rhinocladiella mackenziei CBS 650.93]|uniref:Uncharacterized protein n=1 Tax=Rhinocladiella mackenziei CBS 650.93 TaxID=1442369 RepID=A0A0D2I9D5_9EURO|nr:uncharacterized protein Z518_08375 [Rhinocladiella mackenziei CBS 650.93]KIX02434.1 hypothetical protein Z518_08375 [Rhinocladiella mackenziei CBS 650.93]